MLAHSHRAFFFVFCLVSSLSHAVTIENIRTFQESAYTRLVFDLSDNVEHNIFPLDKPERIVVDLSNTSLSSNMPSLIDSLSFNNSSISNIRSDSKENNTLRVVFDMNSKVQTKSFLLQADDQNGTRLVVDFFNSDSNANTPNTLPSNNSQNNDSLPVIFASANEIENNKRDIVVAVVAGHGGKAPGAIGINKLQEKHLALALAKQIEKVLQQTPGYQPLMIRKGDYGVGLQERRQIAHENRADLFIAIHLDAFTSSDANGATVYALSLKGATSEHARRLAEKENTEDLIGGIGSVSLSGKDKILSSVLIDLSMTASIDSSMEVGKKIISSLSGVTKMRRDTVEQGNFVVLKSADIPSLLIEAGYITNPKDAKRLNSTTYQKKFANALVSGITSYFHSSPPRGTWVSWKKSHPSSPSEYVVNRGDNLSTIAQRFSISLAALKNANNLTSSSIRIDQVLVIPNQFSAASPTQITFVEHTITSGETLSGIANNYSIPLRRIRETNHLNNDMIRIGQKLKIPSS